MCKKPTGKARDIGLRMAIVCLLFLAYFTAWKEVRSIFTGSLIIPQAEAATVRCDIPLSYERVSDTAMVIYRGDEGTEDVMEYRFNAPAGFYLLFGLFFVVLFKGGKKFYQMILGYHAVFAILSVATFYAGLCAVPAFLHLSSAGNSYFTPFFTFFVLILLFIPSLRQRFEQDGL